MNAFADPEGPCSNSNYRYCNHAQPSTILLSDHQRILNEFATKCNRYQSMCVQYAQKIDTHNETLSESERKYAELKHNHESTVHQLKSLQMKYVETEKEMKQFRRKYRSVVPEHLCHDNYPQNNNNRRHPGSYLKNKHVELMKSMLFQNEKYYYYYSDLMELFDSIQVYFNKSRKRYNYEDSAFKKQLFGDKNLNDLLVSDLKQLCGKYELSQDGDKHQITSRLLTFSDGKEEKDKQERDEITDANHSIPEQFKQYAFWKYCDDLEESKNQRIIKLLSGGIARGTEDKEDILLLTRKNDDNSTTEKVFRMDWTLNQWKIITINKKQKRRHNGT